MPPVMTKAILFLFLFGWVATLPLYALPSTEAINASLKSLESTEELDQILPPGTMKEHYLSGYTTLYNRYQVTQEEYRRVEEKFEVAGIPLFFALIPYSESKFQPRSHGFGTAGLWQLTKQSARNFGLTVSKKNDERLNPERSTDAIIRLLLSLKKEFGTWYLADFAYASGEGTLRRLIEKNKTTKLSVLLKDPHFPSGAKSQFAKTLLLDAKIHYTNNDPTRD